MNIALSRQGSWTPIRALWVAIALAFALLLASSPALAHQDHKKKQAEAAQMKQQGAQPGAPMTMSGEPAATHSQGSEMMDGMDMGMDRSKMSFFERLVDWFGRLHPMVVHFPIAFFPAALFTAMVGRRREAFATPVQFLVVAGGIMAPIAALLGWFDAGFDWASDDALLQPHRWLGTFIGIFAVGLAIFAWRKPTQDRGPGMIIGLSIITAAIVIQGWFGGALVHGMDHMNW